MGGADIAPRSAPRAVVTRLAIAILLGGAILCLPAPASVRPEAWRLLAIFVGTIAGIVLDALPMGVMALLGLAAAAVTRTVTMSDALAGFSSPVSWLVVMVFFISRGMVKTGLGARIAYHFMRRLGHTTLGLGYSMAATDLVLAPAIPSTTARAGAVVFPIVRSTAEAMGSLPADGTARNLGAYLMLCSFQANSITSAMFFTAMAANPLAAQLAADQHVRITWLGWAAAASVPGLLSLLLLPWILARLYPPAVKQTPGAADIARQELARRGPMTRAEWLMLGTFVLLLGLWIAGARLRVDSTLAALIGLIVLLLTGVLTWRDILEEREAWSTFIWLSILVMMAGSLSRLGLVAALSQHLGGLLGGMGWRPAFLVLAVIYFASRYFFASSTAYLSAMYATFLAVAIAVGTPPLLAALVFAFFSNLSGGLTHYSTGPAPVFFGARYVPVTAWWRLGGLVGAVNLVLWLVIGGLWWRVLGLW